MQAEELKYLFESVGAIRHGHFELSSGLHSPTYVQCAMVLQYPQHAERLGRELVALLGEVDADTVIAPALGGLIIGHEVARELRRRFVFVERDASGQTALRRGFVLHADERVLLVDDVWTTGGSTRETMQIVRQAAAQVVAAAALIDRAGFGAELRREIPCVALLEMPMDSYPAARCPQCAAGSRAQKPGSRPR